MNTEKCIYKIIDTPCWPCRYKCESVNHKSGNETWRYHRTIEEALTWIIKHEGELV